MAKHHVNDLARITPKLSLYNVIFTGHGDGAVRSVAGHILEPKTGKNIGQDLMYYLDQVYPEFEYSGYRVMPSIPLEEDNSSYAGWLKIFIRNAKEGKHDPDLYQYRRMATGKKYVIKRGWNIGHGDSILSAMYAIATKLVLSQAGLEVKLEDLKFMLVWDWF